MDVFALFSDKTVEKVLLDSFPSRETEKGLVLKTTISSSELKESATKSINNAYLLVEKSYNDIPETIGVCVYGFSYNVIGNSADLAFAVAFLTHLIKKGIINPCKTIPLTIAATGVITERLSIKSVGNIKEKILAAVNKKVEVVFYPYANQKELEEVIKTDAEFANMIKRIRLIPISYLEDIFSEFGLLKTCPDIDKKKSVGLKFPTALSISLITLSLFVFFIFKALNSDIWKENSSSGLLDETSYPLNSLEPVYTTKTPIIILNSPSPTRSEIAPKSTSTVEPVKTPYNTKSIVSPTHPGLVEPSANNSHKPSKAGSKDVSEDILKSNKAAAQSTEVINTVGNTSGNLVNSGFISSQGDFIYFTDPFNVGLYKMKHDGSYMPLIQDAFSTHINVSGDSIYYLDTRSRGLFIVKINEAKKRKVNDDDFGMICVFGDWIYYLNNSDNRLYKVKKNGLDRTPLCNEFQINSEILSSTGFSCSHMNVDNNYIYFYAEFKNRPDKNGIYRMNTDGSDKSIITQDKCDLMAVENDLICFISSSDKCLYRIKSNGSGKKKIYETVRTFNLTSGLIYFSTDDGIYKMNSNGDFISRLTDDSTNKINIAGDWIYYLNSKDGNQLYRIRTNGSNKQPVSNSKTTGSD